MNKSSKRYLDALAEAVKALMSVEADFADARSSERACAALAAITKKLWGNDATKP